MGDHVVGGDRPAALPLLAIPTSPPPPGGEVEGGPLGKHKGANQLKGASSPASPVVEYNSSGRQNERETRGQLGGDKGGRLPSRPTWQVRRWGRSTYPERPTSRVGRQEDGDG